MNLSKLIKEIKPNQWLVAITAITVAVIGTSGFWFKQNPTSTFNVKSKNSTIVNGNQTNTNIYNNDLSQIEKYIQEGLSKIGDKKYFDAVKENPAFIKFIESVYNKKIEDLDLGYNMSSFWYDLNEHLDRYKDLSIKYDELVRRGIHKDIGPLMSNILKANKDFKYRDIIELTDQYEKKNQFDIKALADVYFIKAITYQAISQFNEAKRYYLKAVSLSDDPLYKNNYAQLLSMIGDYKEANIQYEQALSLLDERCKADHHLAGIILGNMASLSLLLGDYNKAEDLQRRSLSYTDNIISYSNENNSFFTGLNNLALIYFAKGEYETAEQLYITIIHVMELCKKNNILLYAKVLDNLAQIYIMKGEYTKVEEVFSKNDALFTTLLGKKHINIATHFNNKAMLYEKQNDFQKAELYYDKALGIIADLLGGNHIFYANILSNKAELCLLQKQYVTAEELIKKSLSIYRLTVGDNHPQTIAMINRLNSISYPMKPSLKF